jgi:transposase
MFIRKTRKVDRKTRKEYFIYQLVESYRTDRGPRQRILLNLGTELGVPEEYRKILANRIEELVGGINSLLKCPNEVEDIAHSHAQRLIRLCPEPAPQAIPLEQTTINKQDYQTVDVNTLEHENCRTVGAEHISLQTFKKLKLDKKLAELRLSKKQIEAAIGVIIGRLVSPGSDRSTHNWLQNQSGLGDLLETGFGELSLDAFYKIADRLFEHKDALENHLSSMQQDLFSFDETIVLYDLTNTYLEGSGAANIKAQRGRSKEKRTDCPLITLGLVLNKYGFPKRSDIFPGNVSEASTLKDVIARLNHSGHELPIIVLDAGLATEDNLQWLRDNKYRYIVSSRKRLTELPSNLKFEVIRDNQSSRVEAAQARDDKTGEVQIYCRSEGRNNKEQAMFSKFQERFEDDLNTAAAALIKPGGVKKFHKVVERIGRLKERHKCISSYYEIDIKSDEFNIIATEITWRLNKEKISNRFRGEYVLRTFGMSWSSEELWNTYVMLTEVEDGFRCMKSDLGLRPVFHQVEHRVDAHLFITLLAYHIMQTIRYQLRQQDIHLRWPTICKNMSTQARVTSSMRLKSGEQLHVRTSTQPEPFHRKIYQALKIPHHPGRRIRTII